MGFIIELRRGQPKARTGRAPGAQPKVGMLERYVDEGELSSAIQRVGPHRLPTLAGLEPYRSQKLKSEAVDSMVREIERIDLHGLDEAELRVISILLKWGLLCRADRDLRIGFGGY
ncbi:hypothetical protein GCM10018781_07290 [Kitasatospora indigofera]|uniref:Uncharacterized protein n=1 Tax=Kitasatospora indigofera TaxID=67307 RepID=A0A919FCL3_9ACTN|nr:hypothetical protein GCM10018781_07290 [Kitasatospora indigofera]